ncbi:MAG TPA: DNA gyrase C-terminal beta-propeller domain-containing protein, partial [Rectinemataceae bacterium]|nr:DNA gyrase C-terminal beta-propeller domain-containing protein [Rectinemataceae bacterium]
KGVVKKVALKDFVNAKTRGIIAIYLDEGDQLVAACFTGGSNEAVLITRNGQALRIHEEQVRVMGRASRGVRGIMLMNGDELAAMLRVTPDETMLIVTTNGYGKRVAYDNFSSHGRGTRGQMIYVPDDVSGDVVSAVSISGDDEAMVITAMGKTIKIEAETVRILGKNARGVRTVNIDAPDFVIDLDKVIKDENDISALPDDLSLLDDSVETLDGGDNPVEVGSMVVESENPETAGSAEEVPSDEE